MISGLVKRLGRLRVTLAYAAALAAVAAAMLHLGPRAQQRVIEQTSTNLHNLAEGRIGTLIGSAFVNQAGPVHLWLPGLVALLALGELLWHSRRLVIAFVIGHIGATLVVAIGIAAALHVGLVSASIVDAADVGMSYGAVAVLGTFTAALPPRWRPAWAGAWLAMALGAVVLTRADFTADGHAVALLLGMVVGGRFGAAQGWTVPRYALLAVAAGFGYLLLAYGDLSAATTAGLGLAGAAAGAALFAGYAAYTNSSADASIQSESQACGGLSSSSPGISHS
ncbi:MAG: hypothetical protein KIH64_003140 [Mycobacterium sp.]|nr:hypothetical protein [Mycobacterium sp.]